MDTPSVKEKKTNIPIKEIVRVKFCRASPWVFFTVS